MSQAAGLTLPGGDVQTKLLALTGQSVNQGSGQTKVQSTVAGLELQGTSGLAPSCGGEVTSGTHSPSLGHGIGLAYVPVERAAPGTRFQIDVRGTLRDAVVKTKPLYRKEP